MSTTPMIRCEVTFSVALLASLCLSAPTAARTVTPGQTLELNGENASAESFVVQSKAMLRILAGSSTGQVSVQNGSLLLDGSSILSRSASALRGTNGAELLINNATVQTNGASTGLVLTSDGPGTVGFGTSASALVTDSTVSGGSYGATITANGILDAARTNFVANGVGSSGLGLFIGDATIRDGSTVTGQGTGIEIVNEPRTADTDNGRRLVVDASSIYGLGGSAIQVGDGATDTDATISLRNGSHLEGADGVAIRMTDLTRADVDIASSDIRGDIVAEGSASANIDLHDAATLTGAVNGDAVAMVQASGTTWTLTGDSRVASLDTAGTTALGAADASAFHTLTLNGPLSGTGGELVFNTVMNEGGPLSNQQTDRLLVEGDVTTTAPTLVTVRPRGQGGLTDTNKNGEIDANEGISLIQVAGASRADAFQLKGAYVAVGAYQYTLHAFGPGETDPAQNALPSGSLNWDYRLGNRACVASGCEPENPGPGEPEIPEEPGNPNPPVERPSVVPQLPSYLSAPAALLTYGDMLNDGLRQRLGEIRSGVSNAPVGGELFARYLGGQLRYSSNRSFQDFGFDFDQQVNALQVGGSVIALEGDRGSLRAGWALDHGTTRVSPHAVDGDSSARYTANGVTAWVTGQNDSGWWVDGVVSHQRYVGDVGTDLRGKDMARIHASGWTMSVEVGKPFALGGEWTVEPRFQLKHQSMAFRDFTDADNLDVSLGTAKQTSARIGALVSRSVDPRLVPYVRVDLTHTSNGDPAADVSSEAWDVRDRFTSGRVGNAVRVGAGATSQLTPHVQLYGEGTYQHFVGSYGMRGWAGNLGVRVTF